MAHTMGKRLKDAGASVLKQGKQLLTRAPETPYKETAVDKALRVAREKLDVAEAKFHTDAQTPLRKAKAALSEAEALYRMAWMKHEKATKR